MKYRHLFFDLDHTLWDFESNARAALHDIYHHHELHTKVILDAEAFFKRYSHHNSLLWARYERGFVSRDELKWKRMWRTLLDGKLADEPFARKLAEHFLEVLPAKPGLFEGAIELLQYLKEKNYKMHIITNGFEKVQHQKMRNSGIDQFFDEVITSEKSGSVKPKPEIFKYALDAAGADVQESIMIGDNLEADIKGAMAAGIDTVFVNHIQQACTIDPTYHISHLNELKEIL